MGRLSWRFRAFGPRRICPKALTLGLIVVAALCAPSLAEGPGEGRGRCARLGGDFAAVSGGEGCVRIGGHVRAENARPDGPRHPAADGIAHATQQIFHVNAGAALGGGLYRR
jgi:hypothetical protein